MKKRKIWASNRWSRRKLEPMINYKYLTIASGATPIGSAGRAPDEELLQEERERKFWVHCRWQAPENKLEIYSHRESGFKNSMISAIALAKSKIEEIEVWRSQRLKKLKFGKAEDWRHQKIWRSWRLKKSKFGDSTRVCNSSRVLGATNVGMPFGYPWTSVPGPAHYGGGQVQGLEDWLGDEEGRF
jgi:hypothetical protein